MTVLGSIPFILMDVSHCYKDSMPRCHLNAIFLTISISLSLDACVLLAHVARFSVALGLPLDITEFQKRKISKNIGIPPCNMPPQGHRARWVFVVRQARDDQLQRLRRGLFSQERRSPMAIAKTRGVSSAVYGLLLGAGESKYGWGFCNYDDNNIDDNNCRHLLREVMGQIRLLSKTLKWLFS